jgi:hypothetical protein
MTLIEIMDKAEQIVNYTAGVLACTTSLVGMYYLFKPDWTGLKNKIKGYITSKVSNPDYEKKQAEQDLNMH